MASTVDLRPVWSSDIPVAVLDQHAFASPLFEFLIGPNKRSFTIHTSIVSLASKGLHGMITNDMKEGREKKAIIEDENEAIWERFCQFAYSGDYVGEDPDFDLELGDDPLLFKPPVKSLMPIVAGKKYPGPKIKHFTSMTKPPKFHIWHEFCERSYPISRTKELSEDDGSELPEDDDHSANYADVFLCHAQLYIFADKWGVSTLENLCLLKLKQSLQRFAIYRSRRRDLYRLVDYCYSSTREDDKENHLTSLVAHYISCVVEHLVDDLEFQGLLQKYVGFSRDLVLRMASRLDLNDYSSN